MIAPLRIIFKIALKQVREKEESQHGKHDKELNQNDSPQLLSPGHLPESIKIEPEYFFYY